MAGFELTLYGRIWVTPKAEAIDFQFRLSYSLRAIGLAAVHGWYGPV